MASLEIDQVGSQCQPVIALETVSFELLQQGNHEEESRLLDICNREGFFYLDMATGSSSSFLSQVSDMFNFMKSYFGKSDADKMRDLQSSYTDG
jgi:hypothetical protein